MHHHTPQRHLRTSFLHFKSNHPLHTKKSLIYFQALRHNRLTDSAKDLQEQLWFLTRALLAKEYPLEIINIEIKKAMLIQQEKLIFDKRQHQDINRKTVVVPFSNQTRNLQVQLNKKH